MVEPKAAADSMEDSVVAVVAVVVEVAEAETILVGLPAEVGLQVHCSRG